MTLLIVIRASPARLKGLWSHTCTDTTFQSTPSLWVSGICVTLYSTMELLLWCPRCGELRKMCRHGRIFGFIETSGVSRWCHNWVCTQGCDTGAFICMSTSCKSHTCKKSKPAECSNVLICCEINALAIPSDHVRAIVRVHVRYGSGPIAHLFFLFLYQKTMRSSFKW